MSRSKMEDFHGDRIDVEGYDDFVFVTFVEGNSTADMVFEDEARLTEFIARLEDAAREAGWSR